MKSHFFLKTVFVFALFILSISLNAQEEQGKTYKILAKGSVSDIQPYIDALNNSNMRYHRLKNTTFTIIFDTGVQVQLFSATELIATGRNLNLNDYPDHFDPTRNEPVFSLGFNNFILEQRKVGSKQ